MTKPSRPPETPAAGIRSAASGVAAAVAKSAPNKVKLDPTVSGLNGDGFALIENASDIIFTHDLTGKVTYLNATAVRITGFTKEEGLTMNIVDIVAPEYKKHAGETMHRKLAGEPIVGVYELEILTKHGERIPMEVNNQIIYEDGKPVGMQGIARDLRERRREQAAFEESENRFRALAETAQSAIFIYKGDNLVFFNHATEQISGYNDKELRGL